MNLRLGPLASVSTWKGIGQIILAGFMGIGAGLIRLFSEPLIMLQAGMDKVMDELFAGLGKIPGLGKALGLDEFQAQSFEQHLAGRRAEGTFLTRAGDQSSAMASGMMQEGMDRVRAGMSGMTDLTGTEAMRAELAGIVDAARDSIAAVAPQVGEAVATAMQAPGAAEAAATGKKTKSDMDIASDRLAKIGLFVGGGQNATQTRLQERTARATERIGELMKKLINKDPGAVAAVWA